MQNVITDSIRALLQQRIEVEKSDVGMVVGLVDEQGSSIVSYGKGDEGESREVDGDTLFEIGSITKTFTGLLLQDMIERGEMKLNDPVAGYLPKSVRLPTHRGKKITLLHLATHTSGLPRNPDNHDPKRADNPEADYTAAKLYAFLSNCPLTRDPGAKFEYSNLGSGLLGHVIALKAGTDYESLVVDRICRPLKMDSTRITLTPDLKARFATGHNYLGYAVTSMDFQIQAGCGGLRSTVNDLLKYVSANLGLTSSNLTPLMKKTHVTCFQSAVPPVNIALTWRIFFDLQGRKIISHGGATFGYRTFVGFDEARRRGVVVLSNIANSGASPGTIGTLLLESEWQAGRRPKKIQISGQRHDLYTGQYRLTPDFKLGMVLARLILFNVPRAAVFIPGSLCLAALLVLLWLSPGWIVPARTILAGGLVAALSLLALGRVVCTRLQPIMDIRSDGDRIFARVTRLSRTNLKVMPHIDGVHLNRSVSMVESLPPFTVELLPESETHFFERMSGFPVIFSRNGSGEATRLTLRIPGGEFSFDKISNQPSKAPEISKPQAIVKLDTKFYNACVGQYEFAPDATFPSGIKLSIRREGDQLVGWAVGKSGGGGEFDLYPESETNFFLKINGAQLRFIKDEGGEVTAVIHRIAGLPDSEGRKLK